MLPETPFDEDTEVSPDVFADGPVDGYAAAICNMGQVIEARGTRVEGMFEPLQSDNPGVGFGRSRTKPRPNCGR